MPSKNPRYGLWPSAKRSFRIDDRAAQCRRFLFLGVIAGVVLLAPRTLFAEDPKTETAPPKTGPEVFIEIDLASHEKLPGGPEQIASGTTVRLTLRNLLPGREYHVEKRLQQPIKPYEWPGKAPAVGPQSDPCRELRIALTEAQNAKDERSFADALSRANGIDCKDDKLVTERNEVNARAVKSFDLTFAAPGLEEGAELAVTVHRLGPSGDSERRWHRRYRVGGSDQWTQSLGLTFFENRSHRYFTEAVPNQQNQFLILREGGSRDIDYAPVYFFTWSPNAWTSSGPGRWFWGVSAGLGFDGEKPIPLFGVSGGLAKNLSLVVGLAAHEALRLRGQYDRSPRPTLSSALTEDQLHNKTYRPTGFIALTYRFGTSAPPIKVEPKQVGSAPVTAQDAAPKVASTSPAADGQIVATAKGLAVTFSEGVQVKGDWFVVSCTNADGTSDERKPAAATITPADAKVFTIDLKDAFKPGAKCKLKIIAANVTDADTNDPPDTMAADHEVAFSIKPPA